MAKLCIQRGFFVAQGVCESGMPPVTIQQTLGHASLDTTLIDSGDLVSYRQTEAFLAFKGDALPSASLVDDPS